ncbi:MAG: hypothetical protein KGL57_06530 [Burkholderiales bacterium]|nr:hypothetical protein [Burkholderiales bacterium]
MSVRFVSASVALTTVACCLLMPSAAWAKSKTNGSSDCNGLPGQAALMAGLRLAHQTGTAPIGNGSGVNWIAVVNRQGEICAVASNDRDAEAAGVAPTFDKGLPLYNAKGVFMGAIAVAGNGSACAHHVLAWRARAAYYLDYVPMAYPSSKAGPVSWSGSLIPSACSGSTAGMTALSDLPATRRNPAQADQTQALQGQ